MLDQPDAARLSRLYDELRLRLDTRLGAVHRRLVGDEATLREGVTDIAEPVAGRLAVSIHAPVKARLRVANILSSRGEPARRRELDARCFSRGGPGDQIYSFPRIFKDKSDARTCRERSTRFGFALLSGRSRSTPQCSLHIGRALGDMACQTMSGPPRSIAGFAPTCSMRLCQFAPR